LSDEPLHEARSEVGDLVPPKGKRVRERDMQFVPIVEKRAELDAGTPSPHVILESSYCPGQTLGNLN